MALESLMKKLVQKLNKVESSSLELTKNISATEEMLYSVFRHFNNEVKAINKTE
jgi:hypothetical protein